MSQNYKKRWQETKNTWFELNQPDFNDYYICSICKQKVHKNETVLDHIKPVGMGGKPSVKFDLDNLQPAHWLCNSKKGSKRY